MGGQQVRRFFDQLWFYKIIALLCAILLAIYTNSYQTGFVTQGDTSKTEQTATMNQTVKVPLQVSMDTNKYFVTGYPAKVGLTLDGPSALVTSTINTQNFRAYIDLTKLKVGRHWINVRLSGLSNQLTATVKPKKVLVDIQKRKSRSMPVQVAYNKAAVADGYEVKSPVVSPSVVNVTGALSEVNAISRVVAHVPLNKDTDKTINMSVMLVALDRHGRQLNVVIEPTTTQVKLPIMLPSKLVKVKINSFNEQSGYVYSLTAQSSKVRIYGAAQILKDLNSVTANVNLKNVKADTTRKVILRLPKGVSKASPMEISIKIAVSASSSSKN